MHSYFSTEFVQDFQKPAHMGAFEFAGQINGQGEITNCVLAFIGAVQDNDGELDFSHADFIDGDVALIGGFLDIRKLR